MLSKNLCKRPTKEEIVVRTNHIEGAWKHGKHHFSKMSGTLVVAISGTPRRDNLAKSG